MSIAYHLALWSGLLALCLCPLGVVASLAGDEEAERRLWVAWLSLTVSSIVFSCVHLLLGSIQKGMVLVP